LLYQMGLVRAGMTGNHFSTADPQFPKRPALGRLQAAVRSLLRYELSPRVPLHTLELGDMVLATVPGEPSVTVGARIARTLQAATGASRAVVIGYAGDYCGYVTTPEEYLAQHYEGASTLYGRNVATHITALLEQCVGSG
jgi:neutral ceramidase